MAGAVSAGAYTAGVIDYLLETLQAWQEEKDKNLAVLFAHYYNAESQRVLESDFRDRSLTAVEISRLKEEVYCLDELLLNALKDKESSLESEDIGILEGYGYNFEIPMHDVVLEVLGGASAGAMTAAVATIALFKDTKPVSKRVSDSGDTGNIIYDSWVNLIDDADSNKGKSTLVKMFSKEDLQGNSVPSLLNSQPIREIGRKATQELREETKDSLKDISKIPYISDKLEIILSLCSLRGIPVDVGFEPETKTESKIEGAHRMKVHKLFAHFGISEHPEDHIIGIDPSSGNDLDLLINCAIASGAFPFGLSSVQVRKADSPDMDAHSIPAPEPKYLDAQIRRMFSTTVDEKKRNVFLVPGFDNFETTVVDGGTINNEPFGEVLKVLEKHGKEDAAIVRARNHSAATNNVRTYGDSSADQGVTNPNDTPPPDYYALLLIDPFPSNEKEESTFKPTSSIEKMLMPLFSAVRAQAMVKEKEIAEGFSIKHTRGLIKPKDRKIEVVNGKEKKVVKEYPIASGSLGGFGGFFKKEFREHDFFLGRKNCQSFLRKHFYIKPEMVAMDSFGIFNSYQKCSEAIAKTKSQYGDTPTDYENALSERKEVIYGKIYNRFGYYQDGKKVVDHTRVRYPIIPDVKIENAIEGIYKEGKVEIDPDISNPTIAIGDLAKLRRPLRKRIWAIIWKLLSNLLKSFLPWNQEEQEIILNRKRREALEEKEVIQRDPETGRLYIDDHKLHAKALQAQAKEDQEIKDQVKKLVRGNFRTPIWLQTILLILALPFLLVGVLGSFIILIYLVNSLTGRIFKAIVSDFKKRGLLEGK